MINRLIQKIKSLGLVTNSDNDMQTNNRPKTENEIILEWESAGKPVPPPHEIKQRTIKDYKNQYNCTILVETGTFYGDMVEAQKNHFNQVVSIELSPELYKKALNRFKSDPNVKIVQGDSGKALVDVMKKINEPAIFWLDGHYSAGETAMGDKECPIYEEIDAIFDGKSLNHVILIDDARLFVGRNDYPTLEELDSYLKSKNPNYNIEVSDDIIRCVAN